MLRKGLTDKKILSGLRLTFDDEAMVELIRQIGGRRFWRSAEAVSAVWLTVPHTTHMMHVKWMAFAAYEPRILWYGMAYGIQPRGLP